MNLDNIQGNAEFQSAMRPGDAPAQPPMMPQQPQPQAWPPNPTAAVSIRGLFKRFDQKIAVNGLALDIPIGSFYGLVGPNGAGKTTTLNMVTGLLVPDAGTAMILGHDVWSDVNTAKRMIGVMPQPDQIFDRLTGLQLLIYSGMLRGMSREETTRRAKDLLNAFDLAQAANKICLASAMIHSPRILVLDEPFESVDPVSSANLKDILVEYAQTGGTVIISSHVMTLVEKMCTHVAVINNGMVCAAGTVDEVASGEELEDRFLQLVGGRHEAAHLAWLDGGLSHDGQPAVQPNQPAAQPVVSTQSASQLVQSTPLQSFTQETVQPHPDIVGGSSSASNADNADNADNEAR